MVYNEQMMRFVNVLFPEGFSDTEEEYGIILFKNNMGRESKKIKLSPGIPIEILDHVQTLDANEVILINSQPDADLELYPTSADIEMYNVIENILTANKISIHNNVIISKFRGNWEATSFKDVDQPGNFI